MKKDCDMDLTGANSRKTRRLRSKQEMAIKEAATAGKTLTEEGLPLKGVKYKDKCERCAK